MANVTPLDDWSSEAHPSRLSRTIGLACVLAIIVLSPLPGDERPHTGLAGQIEHALAYFGTAAFLTMGFRTTRDRVAVATISFLVGLAAVMELLQRMIPGRHSQFIDWFASSLGAGAGVFAIILMERVLTVE